MAYYELLLEDKELLDDLGQYLIDLLGKKNKFDKLYMDKNFSYEYPSSFQLRIIKLPPIGERNPDVIYNIIINKSGVTMSGGTENCDKEVETFFKYYKRKKTINELL